MKREQRNEVIRNLKANGYKQVSNYPSLYLNENGTVYSLKKGRELKVTAKHLVLVDSEYLSIPKLLLLVFRKEPIRNNQHIRYIDGNRSNLNLSNIEYVQKFGNGLKTKINSEELLTAIRCYFEVKKKYKIKDYFTTRIYLNDILDKRNFYIEYYDREGIEIFRTYMDGCFNNLVSVAKEYCISVSSCKYVVHEFINQLINDVLSDLKEGKLTIKDYKPLRKTKAQELRELNEYMLVCGFTPVRLRKRSDREIIRDYEKHCEELRKKIL